MREAVPPGLAVTRGLPRSDAVGEPCVDCCTSSPRPSFGAREQDEGIDDGVEAGRGGEAWPFSLSRSDGCGVLFSIPFYLLFGGFTTSSTVNHHSFPRAGERPPEGAQHRAGELVTHPDKTGHSLTTT